MSLKLILVEKQLRFWAVPFLKLRISSRMGIKTSKDIKHVPPALVRPLVFFYREYENFGSPSFFNIFHFRILMFFLFDRLIASDAKLRFAC